MSLSKPTVDNYPNWVQNHLWIANAEFSKQIWVPILYWRWDWLQACKSMDKTLWRQHFCFPQLFSPRTAKHRLCLWCSKVSVAPGWSSDIHVRIPKDPLSSQCDICCTICSTPLGILLEWYQRLGWHQNLGVLFLWVWSWGMDYKQAFVEWLVMFVKPVLSWIQPFGHESGEKAQVQVWQSGKQHVCGPCLAIAVKKISHWLCDVTLAKVLLCFEECLCFQKKK